MIVSNKIMKPSASRANTVIGTQLAEREREREREL